MNNSLLFLLLIFILTVPSCNNLIESDTTPPVVTISMPQDGSIVSDTVKIICISTDNEGVKNIELFVNNINTGIMDDREPYSLIWNTRIYDDGNYIITVRSCDLNGNTADSNPVSVLVDNTCPITPKWIEKSLPIDSIESGIRPYNDGNGIKIEWHQNTEEDIFGYNLFRSSENIENEFELIFNINTFGISDVNTFFVDDSVRFNIDYFYYLKAYDLAGNNSEPSDTIQYRLIKKAELIEPMGTTINHPTFFEWYDYNESVFEYVIRIEMFSQESELIWISQISRSNFSDFFQNVPYNNDGHAAIDSLEIGKTYRWCIKSISLVNKYNFDIGGSISNWCYFTIE